MSVPPAARLCPRLRVQLRLKGQGRRAVGEPVAEGGHAHVRRGHRQLLELYVVAVLSHHHVAVLVVEAPERVAGEEEGMRRVKHPLRRPLRWRRQADVRDDARREGRRRRKVQIKHLPLAVGFVVGHVDVRGCRKGARGLHAHVLRRIPTVRDSKPAFTRLLGHIVAVHGRKVARGEGALVQERGVARVHGVFDHGLVRDGRHSHDPIFRRR
mmetsp:Transcript_30270/g.102083  ORF Transcript_30270/g.102083 Transcript_30270/m.102083 type:complete len:212 (+) Transcript_30270:231-866(+)